MDYTLHRGSNKILVRDAVISSEIFGRLQQATAGDRETLSELCREYVTEARSTIVKLRQALSTGDAPEMRERAHYLKGSSMMIGAHQLTQCCATLEGMGRDSDLSGAEFALDQAIAALQAVEEELVREIGPMAIPADGSAA